MLKHNLLLHYKIFKRFKSIFFINLIGLSLGLACIFMIYLWVKDELSVDKFHEKDNQLFQVMSKFKTHGGDIKVNFSTPNPLAQTLAEEMPEVEYSVPVRTWTNEIGIVSVGDKHVKASEKYVGKDYFNVFSWNIIQGDREQVLSDKYAVLLSDELAMKLFNTTENIIGESIEWSKGALSGTYLISGIFKSPPSNSTAQFDLVFTFELYRETKPQVNEWSNGGVATYIILKEGTDISQFNEKIGVLLQTKNDDSNWSLFIRPYSEQYLHGKYENGVQAGGRIEYVRLFSIIAIFILLIACINFMNLSTAKASGRMKEIGIKKAIGADRKALIFQFLGESVLMAFLSLIVSIILILVLLPQFNQITGKHLSLIFTPSLMLSVLVITLFTGFIAGSYPALYLSGLKTVTVLKGKFDPSTVEAWVRKGLVVFQFIISVILIVTVLVVYKQIEFIQNKNLGYDKDNVILFRKEGRLNKSLETFLQEVKNMPGVVNASVMWGNMTRVGNITTLHWEGKKPYDKTEFGEFDIGYDLIETLGIELKEGRTFSRNFGSDSLKMILNEAAVKSMGLKDPLGKFITYGDIYIYQVIGVVKNFHLESLYNPLKPVFMILTPYSNNVVVKIQAGKEPETIERIGDYYGEYNQGLPFDYKFLDQEYQALYAAENRVAVLSRYFTGIAILISCLGLFGLASFTTERRLKEIGIRKILGSGNYGIMSLLSIEFMKMVFGAIIVALPISYLIARNWLEDFAYRINLKWWFFIGAAILSLFIAWLTILLQTLKAARMNPVNNLRKE